MPVSKAGSSDVKGGKTIIRGRWREAMVQEGNDCLNVRDGQGYVGAGAFR
jgi:hypothetical protein